MRCHNLDVQARFEFRPKREADRSIAGVRGRHDGVHGIDWGKMLLKLGSVRLELPDFLSYRTQEQAKAGNKVNAAFKKKATGECFQSSSPYKNHAISPCLISLDPLYLTFGVEILVVLPYESVIVQTKRRKLSANFSELALRVLHAFNEPKVLANSPYWRARLRFISGNEPLGNCYIVSDRLLAKHMLPALSAFWIIPGWAR